MPNDNRVGRIGFRTGATWTVGDLEAFASGVGLIYDALLTARIRRNLEQQSSEFLRRTMLDIEKYVQGPFAHEILYEWRRTVERWMQRKGPRLFLFQPYGVPFGADLLADLPPDEEIFANLELHAGRDDHLTLRRAEMSSPGGFSFQGLGDVVQQLRELIRDVWFRNRQDRIEGDLRLIEKVLEMRERHPDADIPLPPPLHRRRFLVDKAAEGVAKLKKLEEERKLLSPPEHLDYDPSRDTPA